MNNINYSERRAKWSPEYTNYHQRVVDACCTLLGEKHREFFDQECDYLEEYCAGIKPEEVAIIQREHMQGYY